MPPARVTFQFRRNSAAQWALLNPVLAEGEPGFEADTRRVKVGDGVTKWLTLPYVSGAPAPVAPTPASPTPVVVNPVVTEPSSLLEHINAREPHPIYDDGPSLLLLYQNAKV